MEISKFIAFYPSRPFWAVGQIDFDFQKCPADLGDRERKEFSDKMAEEVYVDKGDGYTLKLCRDGQVMLQIEKFESVIENEAEFTEEFIEELMMEWGSYLDYLNVLYLLLDSAALEIDKFSSFSLHEVTTRDAFLVGPVDGIDGKNFPLGTSGESMASFFVKGRYLSYYRQDVPIFSDDRIMLRCRPISMAAIKHASKTFSKVMCSSGLEKTLASFSKSLSEYKIGNYRSSVLFSWFIIEAGVNKIWEDHLDKLKQSSLDNCHRINSDRKKYPAVSIICDSLKRDKLLPNEILKKIDKARKIRNNIVHSLEVSPAAKEAKLVMQTAKEVIKHIWDLHFEFNPGYSIRAL
jgi:hypothetical protein